MKKRLLSLLLVIVMVMGMIPTSVFAVENVPFTVTVGGTEMTEITEDVIQWPDFMIGGYTDLPIYTVVVPHEASEAVLTFEQDMQWTYYDTDGNYLGEGDTSWVSSMEHTVAIQDSNGDGALDAISVQDPNTFSTAFLILFVTAQNSCLTVKNTAPVAAETKSGGLYQLKMTDVFEDTQNHDVTYSYTYPGTIDYQFTHLKDGVLSLTAKSEGEYDLVLTATCSEGEVSHTVKLTVGPPNEGIEQQYSYDETDKSSVTVYVTVSNDGMPLETDDGTVLANLKVTVPYFELELYGLQQYNRYETDGGKGPYINTNVVRRPTGLHLYIYLLERYYMGLPEEQCCNGTSGVLDYAKKHDIYYMGGEFAYNSGNNKALVYSGAATSIFMNQFWGHDCNLMYYRNHCYPYMSPGWGSTSDYILLSDGDAVDVAMFTNWGFYHSGYFASFDKDVYEVAEGGGTLTVKTQQWGTSAAAENFVPVTGSEGMQVTLYNSAWEEITTLSYDSDSSNTITVNVPTENGIYFLMAKDPNATNPNDAKIAPAVARIVVGDQSAGGADIGSYYEDYEFLHIKDDQDRYLVDITPGEVAGWSGKVPTHQVIVEDGTEKVYVTFEDTQKFEPYIAIYDVAAGTADYDMNMTMLNITENGDGTVTVEIPVADYLGTGYGVILEDDSYAWKYGFDFVTGTITKVTVGTAVTRILLNSYTEHLWIGDSVTLIPTVLPAEATDWTIQWTSSNEAVAIVDQNGKITAVGDGTAVITAAIGDVKVSCTVTAEKYNTAPTVVSGAPSWAKIKTNSSFTVDAAPMFTDAQNDELIYTAQVYKVSSLSGTWEYNYTVADGIEAVVNNGKITVSIPTTGIYALKITSSDGKLSVTHTYQLTVVKNDAGVIKLNDGVTFNLYNVVAVGYSTEFVEDFEIPYKGTHDTTIHKIVLSKDTVSGTPLRKFAITLASGYQWGQYGSSGLDSSFQTRADIGVFAYDPNTRQSTAHYLKFYTECSGEHTDADGNEVCDKCTLKIEKHGRFAFLAVNENGYLIEPCYVNYAGGATVKEALLASGYDFAGLAQGYIGAVQGVSGSYMLHFDGDGYDLNTPAKNVTSLWITTNTRQGYSDAVRDLVIQMARYNSANNGVKTYAAATTAYIKAKQEFYDTSNAAKLASDLKTAIDAFETFMDGETVTVPMQITQGGATVESGLAVFTSEFGTQVTTEDLTQVKLVPGTYTFDISDGGYQHVRGTIEVAADTSLQATLPTGKWMYDVQISLKSSAYWWNEVATANETNAGATYYVPDYANSSVYCYIQRGAQVEGGSTHQVFLQGHESTRTWESYETTLPNILVADSLDGNTVVLECRLVNNPDDYEQYQTYTIEIVRSPSLWSMSATGDGTAIKIEFEEDVLNYAVTTGANSVVVTPTVLDARTTVTVGGKAAVSGEGTAVKLADCQVAESGVYIVPVVLTASSGVTTTYTLQVTKVDTITVNLVVPNKEVSVQLNNSAGDKVMPVGQQGNRYVYKVIPGETYTYISTKNTYYHATATFEPTQNNETVNVAEPKISAGLTTFFAKTTSSKSAPKLPMDKEFDPAVHEYTTWLDSNSNMLYLQANSPDKKNYTVTAHYKSTRASAYSEYGSFAPKDEVVTIAHKTNESAVKLNRSMGVCGWSNVFYIRMTDKTVENGVTYYEEYILTAHRTMVLNTMSAADHNGNALVVAQKAEPAETSFDKAVLDYTTKMPAFATNMQVTFKVQSSNQYAFDASWYTVTVANGDKKQDVTFTEANIADAVTVNVPLSGTENAELVTITVSHKETGSVAQTYTIAVDKLPPVATTITVNPADATIYLTDDISNARIYPETDGTYILNTDASYTYVISRNGYVAQTAKFTASEDNKVITIDLEKAPESDIKDIATEGDWLQFRADDNNNGVVNVKTPIKAEDAILEWANKIGEGFDSGATGCPIIVGGYLYTYAGNSIVKVNKETGEVVKSGVMAGSSSFAINSPTYANGMIFVALSNGRVQAFNAETLKSLWVFQDTLGGQPNCPIAYCDGYVYTGFWNSETQQANFVCLSVTDEDVTNTTESKLPTWTYTHNGFYWAGAYACEDFVLIGTDDGDSGYTAGYASILSLDPKTGVLLDEQRLTNVGDQRSSICYDAATDAYYFTTKGGDFYQIKVNADGTFVENSLRRLHLDNGTYNAQTPPMSTSTPVIYNGRAYIGVSGGSQFGNFSGHNMTVIDLETFSIAYMVPTMGYPQTSGLLTTAYENTDGYVYVYFIDNASPGMIRVIRDKKGMDEVDHTYTSMMTYKENGVEKTIETGYILFTPYGDEAQYAICSPIADSEGNLYFKNDSARMMRLSSRITKLEITQQPDKQVYCVGKTFDGTDMKVIAHYANGTSKDITQYVSFTTEPLTMDDMEITVSYDPDKLFEDENTAAGGYWQWYQDVDGVAGEVYYLPTATVNITINSEHSFTDYKSNSDATCETDGTKTAQCDHCDAVDTQPDVGSKKGHSFTDYKSDNNATCDADGTKTAVCDRDGCEETDTQPDVGSKKGHSFTDYKSDNNATCETDGTKTAVCDRDGCEEIDTQPDVGSKKGHSFTDYKSDNNATCEADGTKTAVCDRDGCEETDTQTDVGSKKVHSFTDYKSDNNATCEADGTKTAVCDHDGCEETDTQTDVGSKKDHSFTDYKSNNDATCEADGTKTAVCDYDGCEETDTQPDVGSKKGHSFTDYKSDNNATCEADGTKTAVCDHEGCEEKDTQPDVGSKLTHSFTDYKSNNDATYEADGTKTAVCDRDGCEATDTQPDEGSKKVEPETKLEITEGGITVVPDSLKEVGLDTPEKVKQTITKAIITQNSKVDEKNIAHYDVTLMYSEDGGKTWIKADETHWPASGKLKVTLPYPSGTDKTYTFTVVHMFTSTAFGKTPGDVEMPAVTNTDKGIEFEVTGLSPISVGWTAPTSTPESTPSTPATGDTTPVVALTFVMLMSVTALAVLLLCYKKRRA